MTETQASYLVTDPPEQGSVFPEKIDRTKRLRFRNLKFHTGTNWTIRKGLKHSSLIPGDGFLLIPDIDVQDGVQAVVTHVLTCALADVPPVVIKGIHDPDLKNVVLLMDELKKCYHVISGSDNVTCIGFVVLG